MITSKRLLEMYEKVRLSKIKRRLKAAFKRKKKVNKDIV